MEFYDVLEDRNGYIWLAADKGLFRYDGRTFRSFTNESKRGSSVFHLQEDKQGRIWCTNLAGQYFYVEADSLVTFIDLLKELKGDLGVYQLTDDKIFISASSKTLSISLESKEVNFVSDMFRVEWTGVNSDQMFLSSTDKIYKYKRNEIHEIIDFSTLPFLDYSPHRFESVPKLILNKNDTVLLLDNATGFNVFKIQNGKPYKFEQFQKIENHRVIKINRINSEYWICTNKGVHVYSEDFQRLATYFEDNFVTDVISDKDGNFWATTLRDGIYLTPNIHIRKHLSADHRLNISATTTVGNNKIGFGTVDGQVGIFDPQTNSFDFITAASNSKVSSMAYNAHKNALYVSLDKFALIIDLSTKKTYRSRSFSTAKDIIPYDTASIYFISYYGLAYLQNIFTDQSILKRRPIANKRAYASFRSQSKDLYTAFIDDLVKYDSTLKPQTIRNNQGQPLYAISITETKDQTIWVATLKNGIYGIRNGAITNEITLKNGLVSQNISKIKGDGNHLWIVCDKAIQLYDIQNRQIKTLSNQDGIPSYRVTGIEVIDRQVYFGTNEGIFSVNKDQVFKDRNAPDLTISSVSIMEQDTAVSAYYKVTHDQNRFKFEFNSTTFQSPKNISFEYRLLGGNESWLSLQPGSNTINFSSLSSGKYILEARAVNIANKKVSETKSVEILVLKPFWRQWWFVTLSTITVLGMVILIFRKQQHLALEKQEITLREAIAENKINSLKLENLRSQMNPHFIFNALNSIQEYIIMNKKEQATDYLGKFSDLIRGYLTNSMEEMIPIRDELEGLQIYMELEKMRFEEDLSYRISFSDQLLKENYDIPTMLVQPYVENALKHGLLHKKGPKILSVKATLQESENELLMKVVIEDNGIGRERAASLSLKHRPNHKSFGSQATADRLDLLNRNKNKQVGIRYKDLYDDNRKPRGTRVVLIVPIA